MKRKQTPRGGVIGLVCAKPNWRFTIQSRSLFKGILPAVFSGFGDQENRNMCATWNMIKSSQGSGEGLSDGFQPETTTPAKKQWLTQLRLFCPGKVRGDWNRF